MKADFQRIEQSIVAIGSAAYSATSAFQRFAQAAEASCRCVLALTPEQVRPVTDGEWVMAIDGHVASPIYGILWKVVHLPDRESVTLENPLGVRVVLSTREVLQSGMSAWAFLARLLAPLRAAQRRSAR